MERLLLAVPVLVGWVMLVRALDLHIALAEVLGDWWRRLRFTGRHSRRWVSQQAREVRRREEAALDRVWATGIAAWAARARGDGLARSQVAVRWT